MLHPQSGSRLGIRSEAGLKNFYVLHQRPASQLYPIVREMCPQAQEFKPLILTVWELFREAMKPLAGRALLEEVCHWQVTLRADNLVPLSPHGLCYLCMTEM